MKKLISAIICTVLLLLSTGCTSLGGVDFTSTQVEVSEIVEYETVENEVAQITESDVTSDTENSTTSGILKIRKVTKDGDSVIKEDYVLAEDERLQEIDGKTYILKYKNKDKISRSRDFDDKIDVNVYVAKSDSTEVWYDCNTDKILRYFSGKYRENRKFASEIDDSEKITDDEALKIAKDFFKNFVDLTDYNLNPIEYSEESGKFTVRYRVYIAGYSTMRSISAVLAKNGEIISLFNCPYDRFKGITVTEVQEEAIISRLKEEMLELYGTKIETCVVLGKYLDVYDGKAVLVLDVHMVEVPGISFHQRQFGHTIYYPVNLKDYSDVKGTIVGSTYCM